VAFLFVMVMMFVMMLVPVCLVMAVLTGFFIMMMCHSPIVFLGTKVRLSACNPVAKREGPYPSTIERVAMEMRTAGPRPARTAS
jgi:hypothetical protein